MSNPGNNGNGSHSGIMPNGGGRPSVQQKSPCWVLFGGRVDCAKVLLLGVAYSLIIIAAHWLAYLIRFEFHPPIEQQTHFWTTLQWTVPLELAFLYVFGQFRSLLTYFSLPDAQRVILACLSTSVTGAAIWYSTGGSHAPPRSIIVLSFLLDTVGLISVRVLFRILRERQRKKKGQGKTPRRMVIIGAGDVGANLVREMKLRRDLCMSPVAFFDDDRKKWNTHIHGVPVLGRPELLVEGRIRADEGVIAMPSASGLRVREVLQVLNAAQIRCEIVPSMEQLVNGAVKVSQIRPVEIEDLLGREPVCLETGKIGALIREKVVMVTGAGGSIGSELCRQIAGYNPLRLLLVERCEVQIFPIEQELLALGCGCQIVPLVADILDEERMAAIFQRFRPQVVFHAAAHKHVPMMEHQPFEAFRNNTIGTKRLAKLSGNFGVERFVMISTDKAINPTNVMGATKRLAELYVQALQKEIRSRNPNTQISADLETGDCGLGTTDHQSTDRETTDYGLQTEGRGNGTTKSGPGTTRTGTTGLRDVGPMDQRLEVCDGARNRTVAPTGNGMLTEGSDHSVSSPPFSAATKLMAVRFGNVLGSSGSVIPTFKKQIAAGGPITVTHPDVTRYFMTIPEAVGLVLQSATLGQGGEIFVLDMGKCVKIVELARQLIELSGLRPEIDIGIEFTGLRPGEKLFEELNHKTENMAPTDHPKIMRFVGEPLPLETIQQGLLAIYAKAPSMDANQVKLEIQKLVPEYKPFLTGV